LHEEGLLERSRIYATDLDELGLEKARRGIYPLSRMKEYTENYQAAGGRANLSEYYQSGHGHVVFRKDLMTNILWPNTTSLRMRRLMSST
jgi:chemotaxis protein methyltransferase CheR